MTDLLVPEEAPKAVATAHEQYRDLVGKLEEIRAAHQEASEAIEDGRREDVRAMADAMRAGKQASNKAEHERKARRRADEIARQLEAAEVAVDEAGDAVLHAIERVKTAWLAELRDEIAGAQRHFAEAIGTARTAADALGSGRHVAAWLERFEARKFKRGGAPPGEERALRYRPAHSHELRVSTAGIPGAEVIDENISAPPLLDALARAVEPPTPPPPTRAERRAAAAAAQ